VTVVTTIIISDLLNHLNCSLVTVVTTIIISDLLNHLNCSLVTVVTTIIISDLLNHLNCSLVTVVTDCTHECRALLVRSVERVVVWIVGIHEQSESKIYN